MIFVNEHLDGYDVVGNLSGQIEVNPKYIMKLQKLFQDQVTAQLKIAKLSLDFRPCDDDMMLMLMLMILMMVAVQNCRNCCNGFKTRG